MATRRSSITDSSQVSRWRWLRRFLASTLAPLPLLSAAATFQVTIDTTPLAGQQGYLAFDLYKGDAATANQAVVTAFSSAVVLGQASVTGNVVGSLAGSVTLTSSTFFSEFLQALTFAAGQTTFSLALSENFVAGSSPDGFAVFLLNSALQPYDTSDPTGADALLSIDLRAPLSPQVYTSAVATISVVDEPARFVLLGFGLMMLAARGRLGARAGRAVLT
jgi:hypothetical protein